MAVVKRQHLSWPVWSDTDVACMTQSCWSVVHSFPVMQAIAEHYFPRIDNPGGTELSVQDAAGDTYTLRFRYAARSVWHTCTAEGLLTVLCL